MSSLKTLNPKAEVLGSVAAQFMNINAAKGLYDVMKTNLGPRGTIKMLVGGAGDIKLTKDGNVLLREMQIQNPTAVLIARTAVAQDDVTGDGTTSAVILIGELMKQAERYLSDGVHPRLIADGYALAKQASLKFLEEFKEPLQSGDGERLRCVASCALRTKLRPELAERLTDIVVEAVSIVRRPPAPVDLFMVETMHMRHRLDSDTRLVRGLVLDHGARHPDMPRALENCWVLNLNLSLEYERAEVSAGFMYSSAEQREKLVAAERAVVDAKVRAVVALKQRVCCDQGAEAHAPHALARGDAAQRPRSFVVINQKGIDPLSLDLLARHGVLALRRSKRRNAERLQLVCGARMVQSEEELSADALGWAGSVYEHVLGEDKYTFVEDVAQPASCTVLIKAPDDAAIAQIKDALRDGLRAVKNAHEDGAVVPGAGAWELYCSRRLREETAPKAQGKARLGVLAFADAMLAIPRVLAENAGLDAQECLLALQEEAARPGAVVGIDLDSGEPVDPRLAGVLDTYVVKKQCLQSAPDVATNLLLVDEVIRAGMNMRRK